MKTLVCFCLIFGFAAGPARADQFRLREKRDGATYDVSYAKVRVLKDKTVSFEGWTDKYGRITLKLPKGSYTAEVTRGGSINRVTVIIDGKDTTKTVHVE